MGRQGEGGEERKNRQRKVKKERKRKSEIGKRYVWRERERYNSKLRKEDEILKGKNRKVIER